MTVMGDELQAEVERLREENAELRVRLDDQVEARREEVKRRAIAPE